MPHFNMPGADLPVVQFVDGSAGQWPWIRQLPLGQANFRGLHFDLSPEENRQADWLVVFSSLPHEDFHTRVPKERRVFMAAEPEAFHQYQWHFLQQFGTIVTPQINTKHPHVIFSQPAINWFAGVKFIGSNQYEAALRFEDLVKKPVKQRLCSVVTSDKQVTKGHRRRYEFVNLLAKTFGSEIDFYGQGTRTIQDKDEALAPYRYHIALENSASAHYWTEKLADPFLRFCYPIYFGCTNVHQYFDPESLSLIDIAKPSEALKSIERILSSDLDAVKASAIQQSHDRVMNDYNVFAVIAQVLSTPTVSSLAKGSSINSEVLLSDHACKEFKWSRRTKRALSRFLGMHKG